MSTTDQTLFRAAMMDPAAPVPASLTDGAGRPAGRRFSVYRNNVAVSLTEALIEGFPACYAVLGDEMFRGMAGVYLRQHPPASPLMARFGEALPGFLDAAPQVAGMRWIGDLARLEYALRQSYHAADAEALSPETLAAIPPEDLGSTRFALPPSRRVLRSEWPVLSIWHRALDPTAPQAQPGAEDVLILRPDYDPIPHLLSPGDIGFLDALAGGAPLAEAAEAATEQTPDHDPTPILTLLMQNQALLPAQEA
ncbi:putative DNA-binding domain-containing protein [Pseudooceanicola sp.]|uniref:HvfC/BufC family peptide modification chaperone n=1 Tax=Pseudooceanicola sp. TaxID=1914328 RepID=UPI0035C73870